MSWFSDLFESKEIEPKTLESPWQTAFRKKLFEMAEPGATERIQRAGEPYTGELVAPLSEYEETGLGTLGKYLGSELPTESPLYKAATAEVEKTLSGEGYDPFKSEYYQAYKTNMMRELQDAKDRLASATSARDAYYGGGRIAETGRLEQGAMGSLAEKLGSMYEAERVRRLGAVPTAVNLAQYGETAPLARVAAAEQYGALPRMIEQMGLDADQQEYLRQLTDLGLPLDVALGMATYTQPMYTPTYQPSGFSQLLGGLGPLFGAAGQAGSFGNLFGLGGAGAAGAAGLGGITTPVAAGVASSPEIAAIMASLIAMSDIRCKENVASIEDALTKLNQLDGKTFMYKPEAPIVHNLGEKQGGIIAQDLEKVLPEGVTEIDGVKFVKLDAVIGLLVNAVKELNDKVNQIMPELN